MSRRLICPCGSEFFPNIFKDSIQVLCDPCAVAHYKNEAETCAAWVPRSNVISLFQGFTTGGRPLPVVEGTASGLIGGEVDGVTPVPLHPLSPGMRRG